MSLRKRLEALERRTEQIQLGGCPLCAPGSDPIMITPEEGDELISGVCPRCGRTFPVSHWFRVAGPVWDGEVERRHASVANGGMVFTFCVSAGWGRKEDFHDPTADWDPDHDHPPEEPWPAFHPPTPAGLEDPTSR